MALVTGTPVGSLTSQESLFLDSAPSIYFQDSRATPLKNPDADGFYWGLSGTTTYPAFEVGCPSEISFAENVTITDVLCDTIGVAATIQQRNYVEFALTIQSFFPLTVLTKMLKGGTVTQTAPTEKFGFGPINNAIFWHLYTPRVYDTAAGDYVWLYFHKAMFVDAWTISMSFGQPWKATGIKLRAYADSTKPSDQSFGMFGRADASVIT